MFLRKTSRFKDGKRHDYWSVAENARSGTRVVQRQLLYLGEIDEDRQNAWLNAIDELEGRKAVVGYETPATLAAAKDGTTNPFKPKFPQRNKNRGTAPAPKG